MSIELLLSEGAVDEKLPVPIICNRGRYPAKNLTMAPLSPTKPY